MTFQSRLTPLPHQPLWATILSYLDYWNSILNGPASILLPCDLVSKQWSASSSYLFIFSICLFIWLCRVFLVACRIFDLCCGMWDLVLWPGIKPGSPALGTWCLSHWTTRKFASLSRFIPRYFILFDVMVNEIVSLIFLFNLLLLVYRNARYFCVLILRPETLQNSLMSSVVF